MQTLLTVSTIYVQFRYSLKVIYNFVIHYATIIETGDNLTGTKDKPIYNEKTI